MKNNGIWIVNDDKDDHELIREIVEDLEVSNEVIFFNTARDLLERLKKADSAPFIIMCDVNIPGMDGFALRNKLLEGENKKYHSVPFIFWSTYASNDQVERAYRLRAHGFFIKEGEYKEWMDDILKEKRGEKGLFEERKEYFILLFLCIWV